MSSRPLLACLLPVRNGEGHLPDWFRSVERFADVVVALDDGSTDATAELLERHPIVVRLERNPRRETYRGWDDAANRNALLRLADAVAPHWVMSLDVDERLDEGDAAALRRFVEHHAHRELAYGFRVHRMIDSLDAYDMDQLWAYRLHAHERGQQVPSKRLHLVPIPTSIPRDRWAHTTLRIQHLGSLTDDARARRYDKYTEVDPGREYQDDYSNLLAAPGPLRPWTRRRTGTPVVCGIDRTLATQEAELERVDPDAPSLSAIVIAQNDEARIARVMAAIVSQELDAAFEVIVVTSGTDRTARIVREQFPTVTLVELDEPVLPGRARNVGLAVATGRFATFPGSHVELVPGSFAARLRDHEAGWDMVTGTTFNGNTSYAGWASYFLDHSGVLPGGAPQVLRSAPAHCSYRMSLLRARGGFPEDRRTGEDTVVNMALFDLGHTALRDPEVGIIHASPVRSMRRLIAHHFRRGRGMGTMLLEADRTRPVLRDLWLLRRHGLNYLPRRIRAIHRSVALVGGDLTRRWHRALPGVLVGAISAWVGVWWELLRPRPGWVRANLGPSRQRDTVQ